VPESREWSFEFSSGIYLSSSVIRTARISSSRRAESAMLLLQERRKTKIPAEKLRVCIVRVDIYGERNNAQARAVRSREATTSSSPCTYLRHENCYGRSQTFLLKQTQTTTKRNANSFIKVKRNTGAAAAVDVEKRRVYSKERRRRRTRAWL